MPGALEVQWTSDRSLRVRGLAPLAIAQALRGVVGIIDVAPTETAAYVTIDPLAGVDIQFLSAKLSGAASQPLPEPRVHEIPACYEQPHGPDLADVARLAGLSEEEVIQLHTTTEFTVAFMGFMPGFGYLTGLPESLRVPRLPSPRTRLEAGSVGLAGPYSGVYPRGGPGGWRIIARADAVMFGVERDEPALLRAGDVVRFHSIPARAFRS